MHPIQAAAIVSGFSGFYCEYRGPGVVLFVPDIDLQYKFGCPLIEITTDGSARMMFKYAYEALRTFRSMSS